MTIKVTWRESEHPRVAAGHKDGGQFTDKDSRPVLVVRIKGGQGSGNFGHAGRPGEVGGSAAGNRTVLASGTDKEIYRWSNLAEIVDLTYSKGQRRASLDVTDRPEWYFSPPSITPKTGTGWTNYVYGRVILDRDKLREAGWSKDPSLQAEGAWRWLPKNVGVAMTEGATREWLDAHANAERSMMKAYTDAIRGYEVLDIPSGGSLEQIKDILSFRLGREIPVIHTDLRSITDPFEKQRWLPGKG